MTPRDLAQRWRTDAELFDFYGDVQLATVCRRHADALEGALRAQDDEILDLTTGSRESGLSVDRLRHKVAAGEIPNAGRKHAPRIRRGDLPVKRRKPADGFDAAAVARSIVHGGANG